MRRTRPPSAASHSWESWCCQCYSAPKDAAASHETARIELPSRQADDRQRPSASTAAETLGHRYSSPKRGGQDRRATDYEDFNSVYYDLLTDFYEYGLGQSFHFAPRAPNESFSASIARYEHYIAHMLGLRPGMRVLDLGCGVGGPLREIARFSGAHIVGVNLNGYQIQRARRQTDDVGLSHLADFLESDFMSIDLPDGSFDAVYAIEATCHAPDRVGVFSEARRLLKPGGCFASYE